MTLTKKDLVELIAGVVNTAVDKRLAQAGNTKKTSKKSEKKAEKKERVISHPYSAKSKILLEMTPEDKEKYVPKGVFQGKDQIVPVSYDAVIQFFTDYEIGGRPWITYSEQIEHFLMPMMKHYSLSKKTKTQRIQYFKDFLKGKVIKYETQMNDLPDGDKKRKRFENTLSSLNTALKQLDSIKL